MLCESFTTRSIAAALKIAREKWADYGRQKLLRDDEELEPEQRNRYEDGWHRMVKWAVTEARTLPTSTASADPDLMNGAELILWWYTERHPIRNLIAAENFQQVGVDEFPSNDLFDSAMVIRTVCRVHESIIRARGEEYRQGRSTERKRKKELAHVFRKMALHFSEDEPSAPEFWSLEGESLRSSIASAPLIARAMVEAAPALYCNHHTVGMNGQRSDEYLEKCKTQYVELRDNHKKIRDGYKVLQPMLYAINGDDILALPPSQRFAAYYKEALKLSKVASSDTTLARDIGQLIGRCKDLAELTGCDLH
eukprot:COSAG02_NODE_17408_length_1006_cov_0.931643_1_plen_308_part_01